MNIDEYFKEKKISIQFLNTATDDYIGARCCLLNGLITSGYVLSEQAIEKLLKSFILLLSPNEKLSRKHILTPLMETLQEVSKIDLSRYANLFNVLTKAYPFLRYPTDPKNPHILESGITSLSTAVIDEVDDLFIFLYMRIPLPDKVKCRVSLLSLLLISRHNPSIEWFIQFNEAYKNNINYFSKTFEWWQLNEEERKSRPQITILSMG